MGPEEYWEFTDLETSEAFFPLIFTPFFNPLRYYNALIIRMFETHKIIFGAPHSRQCQQRAYLETTHMAYVLSWEVPY